MAIIDDNPDDFPFPEGYEPPWEREQYGEWWNNDTVTSNYWCCKPNGSPLNNWQWFIYDLYYMMFMLYFFFEWQECPNEGALPFYFMSDNCQGTDDIKLSSNPTDDGTGYLMIQGSTISNMKLILEADQNNYGPDLVLQSASGIISYVDLSSSESVKFFARGTGYYDEVFFQFDTDEPVSDVIDSVIGINSTPSDSHDSNIYLKPSAHGYVKFGEWEAIGQTNPSVTGFITMVDSAGNIRKLATIDDGNSSQQTHYEPT